MTARRAMAIEERRSLTPTSAPLRGRVPSSFGRAISVTIARQAWGAAFGRVATVGATSGTDSPVRVVDALSTPAA